MDSGDFFQQEKNIIVKLLIPRICTLLFFLKDFFFSHTLSTVLARPLLCMYFLYIKITFFFFSLNFCGICESSNAREEAIQVGAVLLLFQWVAVLTLVLACT